MQRFVDNNKKWQTYFNSVLNALIIAIDANKISEYKYSPDKHYKLQHFIRQDIGMPIYSP